jgi:hypothetical protein
MHRFFHHDGERKLSPLTIAAFVVGGIILMAALALFFGWIVLLLWNWLMPEIFGLPRIGYWQAWGLVLLSHILVKGGFGHGGHGSHGHGPHGWRRRGAGWKDELKSRFESGEAASGSGAAGSGGAEGGDGKTSGTGARTGETIA